jgi:hypothetical protein
MLALLESLAVFLPQAPQVFFGDLLSHTALAGSGTPSEAYDIAKAAVLDFLAVTEHNHKGAEGSGEQDPAGAIKHTATLPTTQVRVLWVLDSLGTLAAAVTAAIHRHSQPMSMNNNGVEVIELVSPNSSLADEIRYEHMRTWPS